LPGEQQSATIKVVIVFVDKTGFPWLTGVWETLKDASIGRAGAI
jgi:hypothetical protein